MVCLFILLILSFAEQKFLRKFSLSIIYFMDYAFGVLWKKLSPYPRSSMFLPILSSRSLTVLHFTFTSPLHFELNFVKGARSVFGFFSFACGCWVILAPIINSLFLLLCQRSVNYICVGLFLGSLFFSIDICLFFHQYHIVLLSVSLCKFSCINTPNLFSLNNVLAILGLYLSL